MQEEKTLLADIKYMQVLVLNLEQLPFDDLKADARHLLIAN